MSGDKGENYISDDLPGAGHQKKSISFCRLKVNFCVI